MFKNRSRLLITITGLEIILSVWALFYFNYMDRLNYSQSIITPTTDLALLIEDMYTSTWWALIILCLCIIAVSSLISVIYKDLKFHFMAICLWFILFILALDIKDSFLNTISVTAIFIPILTANIIAYYNQKKILTKKSKS